MEKDGYKLHFISEKTSSFEIICYVSEQGNGQLLYSNQWL
jgi:hypothetical protein